MKLIQPYFLAFLMALGVACKSEKALAHCEIPCGIYEDSVRVALIMEHISTIEKSMKKIEELSKAEKPNYNQIVRWVNNKEEHAKKIQQIVSQYFLHQRIKMVDEKDREKYKKYINHLGLLHQVAVYSMKAKQGTDLQYIEKLRTSMQAFSDAYFHKHPHPHNHNHPHGHKH